MDILIVGNIIKDIYLNFETELFELDEQKDPWIDIKLDGEAIHFKSRESVLSGAAITQEVLRQFGLTTEVSRHEIMDGRGDDYRYVIKTQNKKTKFLTSKNIQFSVFIEPETPPDWIYIDRSANLRMETIQKILRYLERTPRTKLAVFLRGTELMTLEERINFEPKRSMQKLVKKADLIFTSGELERGILSKYSNIYQITTDEIRTISVSESIKLRKNKFLTHLSIYSIASATIFAGLVTGWTENRALRLAKINIENSRIGRVLSIKRLSEKLKQHIKDEENLRLIARLLVSNKKGILAIDESPASIRKKLHEYNLDDSKENCWKYRNLLITTPELNKHINGIILSAETADQKMASGQKFVDFLTITGIISGIKVDLGLKKIKKPGVQDEYYTLGINNLADRLVAYYNQGFRFTKWRAVFYVDSNGTRSSLSLIDNINIRNLASYTKEAIEARLVPIIEPEVINKTAGIKEYYEKTRDVLFKLFEELNQAGVDPRKYILKMNMIYDNKHPSFETGKMTMRLIREVVPMGIGGIVFLSGGQFPEQATENLSQIMERNRSKYNLSFSFGRAVQDPALELWRGIEKNTALAQRQLIKQLSANQRTLN